MKEDLSQIEFVSRLSDQYLRTLATLAEALTGNDEISGLVYCVVNGVLLERIDLGVTRNWIVYWRLRDGDLLQGNAPLLPYSTSMDCQIPGECIVMLARQHEVPGTGVRRWTALQENANKAQLANDPILACRLNALSAFVSSQDDQHS
jgi:hypothetical protein